MARGMGVVRWDASEVRRRKEEEEEEGVLLMMIDDAK